jgi:ribokinase
MDSKICIVGSSNIDQIAYVDVTPHDGETVFGSKYQMGFGGKGANQAVMAGLMGAQTFMITCLGDDVYADMTIENYKNNGVNVDYIQRVEGSSGVAPIWVDKTGQNRIIVISGANDHINADKAIEDIDKISNLNYIILNPAPAKIPSDSLLQVTDWFIPNEIEFETITGSSAFDDKNLLNYSNTITGNLIVTLGDKGAAFISNNEVIKIEAPTVSAIDTTGAGDAFVGAFSAGLANGLTPIEAVKLGVDRASDSVTKTGTQSSYAKK